MTPIADLYIVVLIVISVHWGALALAARFWPFKRIGFSVMGVFNVLIGLASIPVVLVFLLFIGMVQSGTGDAGQPITWYLIYGVVSLGIVPAFLIFAHVIAGRFFGALLRKYLEREEKRIAKERAQRFHSA